jgi:hypothetical protein
MDAAGEAMFGDRPPILCPRCMAPTELREERIPSSDGPYFSRILGWYACTGCEYEYASCPCCHRGLMYDEPPWKPGATAVLARCTGGCGFARWRTARVPA